MQDIIKQLKEYEEYKKIEYGVLVSGGNMYCKRLIKKLLSELLEELSHGVECDIYRPFINFYYKMSSRSGKYSEAIRETFVREQLSTQAMNISKIVKVDKKNLYIIYDGMVDIISKLK